MNEVFEKARALGQAIVESEEFKTMRALEDEAMAMPEVAQQMTAYLEHKQGVETETREGSARSHGAGRAQRADEGCAGKAERDGRGHPHGGGARRLFRDDEPGKPGAPVHGDRRNRRGRMQRQLRKLRRLPLRKRRTKARSGDEMRRIKWQTSHP